MNEIVPRLDLSQDYPWHESLQAQLDQRIKLGIRSHAFEKHRIKRADRLLSNPNLQRETPHLYAICFLFCRSKHPVIAVDWSDLDDHKGQFLLRAAMVLKGRPVTLYQEVHSNKTKEKPATHKGFLATFHTMLPSDCQAIIVTDAGYKSPWFRQVRALGWHVVGRGRKPHFYSLDNGHQWQSITQLYQRNVPSKAVFTRQALPDTSHLNVLWYWSSKRTKAVMRLTQMGHVNSPKCPLPMPKALTPRGCWQRLYPCIETCPNKWSQYTASGCFLSKHHAIQKQHVEPM